MKKRLLIAFMTVMLWMQGICPIASASAEIIINDTLTDLSQVIALNGFSYSNNHGTTCTPNHRRVFYRSDSAEAYAIYDFRGATQAEFDVTVSNSEKWKLTDSGQIDNIIYLSSDGINYTDASTLAGYTSESRLVSTQNNHHTYTLHYAIPAGYQYVKFDASKFSFWQMYLIGARTYGKKPAEEEIQPIGHVSVGDGYVMALSGTDANAGFDINRYIGSKTGYSYVRNAAVKTATTDVGYLIYQAKKSDFCYLEAEITVESFKNAWRLTGPHAADNNICVSENGTEFIGVPGIKTKFIRESFDGATGYSTFLVYGALPKGTRYVKIDAGEFESWNFVMNEILLYSEYGANEFDYEKAESLAAVHADDFRVAVAVEPNQIYDYHDILLSQFNELTIENQMKPNVIHQSESAYYFEGVDRIVEFAQKHGLKVRGHGLVYEKAMPGWFFVDENGNKASKELVMKRLEEHVRTIVRRYKGKVYCYDVVNENFGHQGWDTRELSAICGVDEYTRKVFQWAHEEDPDAILILNDNYYDIQNKTNLIFNYVKGLVEDGVPIHGIGFQEHHFIDTDLNAVEEYLTMFETIPDFKLFVTELDVRAYNMVDDGRLYPSFMSDELKNAVAKKYASLFDIYRKHSERIETLGLWNVSDAVSWTDSATKKQFATLIAEDKNPNPAFFAALDVAGECPRWEGNVVPPILKNCDYYINQETDTLSVCGSYSGMVTAKLFRNYGAKEEIAKKTIDASGAYEIRLQIADASYDGSISPDYRLEVTEGETSKTDEITYFTKANRNQFYTVTDDLNDYRKLYRVANTMFKSGGIATTRIWNDSAYFRAGEAVYACPYGFEAESFFLDMYKYSGDYYTVSVSRDDVHYEPAELQWAEMGTRTYRGTIKTIPEGIRYIKINFGITRYNYLSYAELHTRKSQTFEEGEGILVDSTLENSAQIFENQGFELVNWAAARCGYGTGRNIYTNTGNASHMMFDAGINKRYNKAEFRITLHGYYTWPIEQSVHLVNRILVSDDGVNWKKEPGISYTKDEAIGYDGSTPYRTFTLKAMLEKPARYLKLDFGGAQTYSVFVHHATLWGGTAFSFVSQPIVKRHGNNWIAKGEYRSIHENEMAVLAVYSNDKLISCDIRAFSPADSIRAFDLSAENLQDKDTFARLYIWTSDMVPVYQTQNIY